MTNTPNEITPAMIEAGAAMVYRQFSDVVQRGYSSSKSAAKIIYEAMECARCKPTEKTILDDVAKLIRECLPKGVRLQRWRVEKAEVFNSEVKLTRLVFTLANLFNTSEDFASDVYSGESLFDADHNEIAEKILKRIAH